MLPDAPLGYLTAYDADKPRLDRAVELWPRMQQRPVLLAALAGEDYTRKRQVPPQVRNVRKLTHAYALFGAKPLPLNFARRIMGLDREGAGERWLAHLPDQVATRIREIVEPRPAEAPVGKRGRAPDSLTYSHTARRSFEVAYWKTIASLAEAPLLNKNNADCVLDEATQRMLPYRERHLERLGDELLAYYAEEDRGRENDRQGACAWLFCSAHAIAAVHAVQPDAIIVDHLAFSARLALQTAGIAYADVVLGPSERPAGGRRGVRLSAVLAGRLHRRTPPSSPTCARCATRCRRVSPPSGTAPPARWTRRAAHRRRVRRARRSRALQLPGGARRGRRADAAAARVPRLDAPGRSGRRRGRGVDRRDRGLRVRELRQLPLGARRRAAPRGRGARADRDAGGDRHRIDPARGTRRDPGRLAGAGLPAAGAAARRRARCASRTAATTRSPRRSGRGCRCWCCRSRPTSSPARRRSSAPGIGRALDPNTATVEELAAALTRGARAVAARRCCATIAASRRRGRGRRSPTSLLTTREPATS